MHVQELRPPVRSEAEPRWNVLVGVEAGDVGRPMAVHVASTRLQKASQAMRYTAPDPKPTKRPKKPPKGLARKTRLRARSATRKRNGADPAYLEAVRQLPCFVSNGACDGPIHAHHAIHRSQGGKDRDAVPLCHKHHEDWHCATGFFRDLTKEQRPMFADAMIAATLGALAAEQKRGW